MEILLLLLWFVFLIKWADLLVDWSSSIAKRFHVSDLIIGLTVVAFWTSAPELVINLFASAKWNTALAIWNILWSNISNILLILWISAIIYPLAVHKDTVWKEIPFWFLVTLVLAFLANDMLIDWSSSSFLTRIDWLVLLSFFIIFIYYTFLAAKSTLTDEVKELVHMDEIHELSISRSIIYLLIWLTWLTVWGDFIVKWAMFIALQFWMTEAVIWLTVVAIWTSLPELATSAMAAYRQKTDIAIWNVVWSNIFNILWVLWISSLITPLPSYPWVNNDIMVALFASLLLFIFIFTWENRNITKFKWIIFVVIYISYMGFLVFREIWM